MVPSFGSRCAMFLFHCREETGSAPLALLQVTNPWAIFLVELLLQQGDVREGWHVVAVFRDCDDAGLRSDDVRLVSLVELVTELVEPGRFVSETRIAYALQMALGDEERAQVLERCG